MRITKFMTKASWLMIAVISAVSAILIATTPVYVIFFITLSIVALLRFWRLTREKR